MNRCIKPNITPDIIAAFQTPFLDVPKCSSRLSAISALQLSSSASPTKNIHTRNIIMFLMLLIPIPSFIAAKHIKNRIIVE